MFLIKFSHLCIRTDYRNGRVSGSSSSTSPDVATDLSSSGRVTATDCSSVVSRKTSIDGQYPSGVDRMMMTKTGVTPTLTSVSSASRMVNGTNYPGESLRD